MTTDTCAPGRAHVSGLGQQLRVGARPTGTSERDRHRTHIYGTTEPVKRGTWLVASGLPRHPALQLRRAAAESAPVRRRSRRRRLRAIMRDGSDDLAAPDDRSAPLRMNWSPPLLGMPPPSGSDRVAEFSGRALRGAYSPRAAKRALTRYCPYATVQRQNTRRSGTMQEAKGKPGAALVGFADRVGNGARSSRSSSGTAATTDAIRHVRAALFAEHATAVARPEEIVRPRRTLRAQLTRGSAHDNRHQ